MGENMIEASKNPNKAACLTLRMIVDEPDI